MNKIIITSLTTGKAKMRAYPLDSIALLNNLGRELSKLSLGTIEKIIITYK